MSVTEIRLQARQKGVGADWVDVVSKIHVEAARELAERIGLSGVIVETRDHGSSVTFPHLVERVTGYRVKPLRGDQCDH